MVSPTCWGHERIRQPEGDLHHSRKWHCCRSSLSRAVQWRRSNNQAESRRCRRRSSKDHRWLSVLEKLARDCTTCRIRRNLRWGGGGGTLTCTCSERTCSLS